MYEITCDVAIIGAGPAGLSAAVAAKKEGAERVLLIERDESVGGILQQCIHPGFGLTYFKEELTGPEYAGRFGDEAEKLGAEVLLNSMVLEVVPEEKAVYCVNSQYGMTRVKAGSIILAMGCREKTRAGIQIPGTRPAGVYTAGAAQRLMNRQNAMVGREVVILGSGDIGMIMARRMSLEGAHVKAVVEIMDFLAGLTRNKVQCLDDFNIPLKLSHTVTRIVGNERVEGVYVAAVDESKKPISETEEFIPCDTLLLSVGLLPENELTRQAGIEMNPITNGPSVNQYMQTSVPGIFACGRHRVPTCGFIFREKALLPHIRRDMIDFLKIPFYAINSIKQGEGWTTPDGDFYPHERLVFPAEPARTYAYFSDTSFMPQYAPFIQGIDLLYHEATFGREFMARARETQHSTAAEAAEMARLAQVKQLVIGHFSSRYEDEQVLLDEASAIFANTTLAKEGRCIQL